MKSLLVTRKAEGGIKTHLEILAGKLPGYNIKPMICGPAEDYKSLKEIDFFPLSVVDGINITKDLKSALKLRNLIKEVKPDILHSHGYKSSLLVGLANCFFDFPWIVTIHNFKTISCNRKLFSLFLKLVINRANIIQVVSNSLKDELVSMGVDKNKCSVLYNGVSLTSFHRSIKSRKELSLPKGRLVGCVGRLNYDKGIDKFLYANRYILDNYFNYLNSRKYNFVIIGNGPEKEQLKQLSWNLGIASKVYFLGKRDDINDILKHLELLCIPSRQEGLSITAIEAMASLCPVVAVKSGGLKELFRHKENGILVSSNQPWHLGEGLMWVLKNKKIKRKISWQGYINAIDNFSDEVMLKNLVNLYKACGKRC